MKQQCINCVWLATALLICATISAQSITNGDTNPHLLQKTLKNTTNPKEKLKTLYALGKYYQTADIQDTAISYKLEAVALQKQLIAKGDTTNYNEVGNTLMGIVRAYLGMGLPEQAKQYAEEAMPYVQNNKNLKTLYYKNMADALRQYAQAGAKSISEAKIYYDSLTNFCATKNNKGWQKRIALDLSFTDYYLSINKPDSAFNYIKAAQLLAPNYADTTLNAQITYMAATIYLTKKEYSAAIPYLLEAEKFALAWDANLYVNLLRNIGDVYAETGNYALACNYYKKYVPLRDTLYVKATEKSFAEAEAKFQNKDKQQQIQNKNLQLKVGRDKIGALLAGIVVLIVVATALFFTIKNKKKAAKILNEKNSELAKLNEALNHANQTKAKLFGIIGHDLRSPISHVYQFLKLQQVNPELLTPEQKDALSNKIQTATGSLLETMEDLLLWSKTQMNEFSTTIKPTLIAPVIDTCTNLLQLNSDAKNITYYNTVPENSIINTDCYFLQTILRNLLQNAIKASPNNSEIKISITESTPTISINITNKGETLLQKDYEKMLQSAHDINSLNGLGLRLTDELSKKIGAIIQFQVTGNSGTHVKIIFVKDVI